ARVDIKLATTEDSLIDLEIRAASIPDTYEKEEMTVDLKIQNNGNTNLAPSKVEVTVQNLLEKEIAVLETDIIEQAPAYVFSDVKAIIKNHGLVAGEYYGNIKVFVGGESLYENRVVFNVLPEKVFEEVCSGAPEVISNNRLPIFVGVSLIGLALTAYYTFKEMKNNKKMKKNKKLINLLAFLFFMILMYLVFIQDVIGVMERKCWMELVPPTQNSESDQIEATNTPSVEPSSSVQGAETEKTDESQTTFDELNVGLTTQDSKYRVYETNSLSANVIYLAEEGEQFKMIQETAEWYRIELSNGQTGWLPKNSTKDVEQITVPD
ncbi:MAG TPA: SH3 domain-containing protein, partial [Candidatus Dojkabacteria bacterium]|nr:SH3 domain-containing protein [Candidatus Dojkabacteria bacterium]